LDLKIYKINGTVCEGCMLFVCVCVCEGVSVFVSKEVIISLSILRNPLLNMDLKIS